MDAIMEQYLALEKKILGYNPNLDTQRLLDAFTFADKAHDGQKRKSGEPYIIHPLAVADIVAEMELIPTPSSPLCSTMSLRTPAPPVRS